MATSTQTAATTTTQEEAAKAPAKKTATKRTTAKKSAAPQEQAAPVGMLDLMPALEERQHYMLIEVLRQECGSYMARQARVEGREFDWEAFNENFRAQYAETPTKVLASYAKTKFGLKSMAEVREQFGKHSARRRHNAQQGRQTQSTYAVGKMNGDDAPDAAVEDAFE